MTTSKVRHDVRGRKTTPQQRKDVRAARGGPRPADQSGGGAYALTYGNGPLVECLYTYAVFVGSKWQDNTTYGALAGDLQVFLGDLFQSKFIDINQQYGFLVGVFNGAHYQGAPASSALSDSAVQQIVAGLHQQGIIPDDAAASSNQVNAHGAILFLDDTVTLSDALIGGSFCAPDLIYGYHYYNSGLRPTPIYYGVISSMSDACVQGDPNMEALTQLQRITVVASHEISELVSDPQPGSGWYSQTGGEIGDICEGDDATFTINHPDGSSNTWTVQTIYSLYDDENGTGTCVSSTNAPRSVPTPAATGAEHKLRESNVGAAHALLPLPPISVVPRGTTVCG